MAALILMKRSNEDERKSPFCLAITAGEHRWLADEGFYHPRMTNANEQVTVSELHVLNFLFHLRPVANLGAGIHITRPRRAFAQVHEV
jgi:hypothetical protein